MKMKYKRIMAAGMVFVMLCTGTGSAPVYGAQPSVDVDETMYVNLDYYGRVDKINVVKGVGLNGQTEFMDYGTYENVINMSNSIEPVLGDGMVTWQLPEDQRGRFYFKCSVDKGMMVLPWDFDVSYKLNGVPMDGDKLAGASGLIEINVKAEPNDNAGEYYRNNMMLMVAVPVDMSKCYSVEAEGSQTQNLGETTAVVFTALPGEDGDYTVRIGTDSFETIGVIMAMVPGTVEDLEHIKDLKEAKDTWQDAGDELYDSLEQLAKSVENMRQGVNQVRQGMDSAESARQKWSNSKDSILAGNDQTLAALTSVSQQMDTMIPHLQTAKDCAEVVHSSMNDIVNTLGDMQDPLRKLQTRLKNIENSAGGISSDLPELQKTMESIIALDTQLQASQDTLLTYLSLYKSSSTKARRLYDEELDEEELENMEDVDQMAGAIRHPAEAAARKTPRIIIRGMTREAEIPAAVRRGKITRMEVPEEAEAQTETEAPAELGAGAEMRTEAQPGAEAEPEAEIQPEAQARTEAQPGAEAEIQPEAEVRTEAQPGAEAEIQPEAQVRTEAELEPEAEIQPEAQARTEAQPGAEAEIQPEAEVRTEAQPGAEAEIQPEAQVRTEAEIQPEAKAPTEAQPGAAAQAQQKVEIPAETPAVTPRIQALLLALP